ncbi:MAG: hypothetical protein AAB855_04920 [Patescibacteria group bacterium]
MKNFKSHISNFTLLLSGAMFALLLGAVLLSAVPADAQLNKALFGPGSETNTLITNLRGSQAIQSPGVIVFNIIQIVLGFLGIVGVIMMVYAGFLWLTAGGEEEKAKQGRTLLFQALIGTFIVLAAYTITYFVIDQLTKAVTNTP